MQAFLSISVVSVRTKWLSRPSNCDLAHCWFGRILFSFAHCRSLYVVFMATFLAIVMFFWLELFGDLAAGNMQVSHYYKWGEISATICFLSTTVDIFIL